MATEYVKQGYKITIGRKHVSITTYENLPIQTSQPIKKDKPKKIKPSIPSNYADFNYYKRRKERRKKLKALGENNFDEKKSVSITLTFDACKNKSLNYTDLGTAHKCFYNFIKRVNDHYDGFQYIVTFSRQTNGNWHYHMICNFGNDMNKEKLYSLWQNGYVYIRKLNTEKELNGAIKYLISNMQEYSDDKRGKHGYLASHGLQGDIGLISYHGEQEEEYAEAFERVDSNPRKIMYETKNPIGVIGKGVDEETGEIFNVVLPDREINDTLKNAGYEKLETTFTYLSSAARFPEKFQTPKTATPKSKKFKRKKV